MGRIDITEDPATIAGGSTLLSFRFRTFARTTTRAITGIHARFFKNDLAGTEHSIVAWT